jgi:chloramphenicol-sensitive protein RarD
MKKTSFVHAITAYVLWGLFPIYWKWLRQVDALQVIGHRIVWSFIFLTIFLIFTRQFNEFRRVVMNRRALPLYFVSATLIGGNWLAYVWAVNHGFIIEASLGYFIFPLLSILIGVLFLRESLRPLQWIPVGLAAFGVIYLSLVYGRPPWISLTLALTFTLYGLVKKLAPLDTFFGQTLEAGILFIPAVLYILYADFSGAGAFLQINRSIDFLLIGAGIITTIPLLLFSSAAKCLPLYMLGILQYIAPTIAFLLGTLIYEEPFDKSHQIGFVIVWSALVLFILEGVWAKSDRTPKSLGH